MKKTKRTKLKVPAVLPFPVGNPYFDAMLAIHKHFDKDGSDLEEVQFNNILDECKIDSTLFFAAVKHQKEEDDRLRDQALSKIQEAFNRLSEKERKLVADMDNDDFASEILG